MDVGGEGVGGCRRTFKSWLPELGGQGSPLEAEFRSALLSRKPPEVGEGGWHRWAHVPDLGGQSWFIHTFLRCCLSCPLSLSEGSLSSSESQIKINIININKGINEQKEGMLFLIAETNL